MIITEENKLAAPCGLYCGACSDYLDDSCPGCRLIKGKCNHVQGDCATYACVEEKGHEFCHECREFPCDKIQPAADMADKLPHNMKVFNLAFIKNRGLSEWLNHASDIRNKYLNGKMKVGEGPKL